MVQLLPRLQGPQKNRILTCLRSSNCCSRSISVGYTPCRSSTIFFRAWNTPGGSFNYCRRWLSRWPSPYSFIYIKQWWRKRTPIPSTQSCFLLQIREGTWEGKVIVLDLLSLTNHILILIYSTLIRSEDQFLLSPEGGRIEVAPWDITLKKDGRGYKVTTDRYNWLNSERSCRVEGRRGRIQTSWAWSI